MKPTRTYEATSTLDLGVLGERDCQVQFKYWPGHPGTWYRRNGDPGDPPEPAEVEVTSVTVDGWDITELAAEYLSESDDFMEAAWAVYESMNSPEAA